MLLFSSWVKGRCFLHRLQCTGTLISVIITLVLLPQGTECGINPKAILWLIRLKNMKYYNLQSNLFNPLPVSDELDGTCRRYDLWLHPLSGSRPALSLMENFKQPSYVTSRGQDILVSRARETMGTLEAMLNTYQSTGIFINWRSKQLNSEESFIPNFLWRKPWNLQERPGDVYRLLSTYARILHYYKCILDNEQKPNRRREINSLDDPYFYTNDRDLSARSESNIWNTLLKTEQPHSVQKRVFGIDNEEHFNTVGHNLYLMLGDVYLALPDKREQAMRTLTIEHDVDKAVLKMRRSESIGMRVYYRALLCLELYQFTKALASPTSWQTDEDVPQPDISLAQMVALQQKLKQAVQQENELIKDLEILEELESQRR